MSGSQLPEIVMTPLPHRHMTQDSGCGTADDQQSRESDASFITAQRTSSLRPSSPCSHGSPSSSVLRLRVENLPPARNTSQSSLSIVSSSSNVILKRRVSSQTSLKSNWGNQIPPPTHLLSPSHFLFDAGPLEDIDLNAGSTHNTHDSSSDSDHDPEQATDRELSFDIKEGETLSTVTSNASQKAGAARTNHIASDRPVKADHTFRRLANAFGPKRAKSLTLRKERWILDDLDELKPARLDLPKQRQGKGHQKASSWAPFGFVTTARRATVNAGAASEEHWVHQKSKSRFLRSNRSSRLSNVVNNRSVDGGQETIQSLDLASWDRAVQRRKIVEELISSEESYIADLKVLLHVSDTQKLIVED
ncbi:hypothetical protein OEA41_007061 [Lepraria neglecta]|uniref:DH domain-containing protein n=1 Tax=Lepraria neglecta TaxID=209136 RepID=A0AAD9Z8T6_9LECA|nr:hypothetical protein OEA41_007061 [Lepraria neglecta]